MLQFIHQHSDLIITAILTGAPVFLPVVNQYIAKLTGNVYIKKGFAIAELLKDGLTVDEITEALLQSRKKF